MTTHLPLLTVSRASAFRACPRYHHVAYNLGYRTVYEEDTLRFGKLVHLGLEAWWLTKSLDAALAAMAGESDPFDLARAEVALMGYDERWRDEPLETLAVEIEFLTELRNPDTGAASRTFSLAGKIDAIARWGDRVVVVEHKTSSEDVSPGSTYWRRLRLDAQVSTYLAGARSLGYDPASCLYDVLAKPGIRPLKATPFEARKYRKKDGGLYEGQRENDESVDEFRARLLETIAENPERYYARGEVVRLEQEEADAAFDLWSTGRAIREAQVADRHPRNPGSCLRWGRECSLFDVCTGTASLDDTSRFKRLENVHAELTLQTTQETPKETAA